ncbi:MAG: hydroxylamine reductase, partial [Clostridiales bacterium]|nr:hydroxylamine reductase [Clostridiales bacterium]
MFCYQCQETAGNKGCTKVGVCGKQADTSNLQDLLIYASKGISEVTTRLRAEGKTVETEVNHMIVLNLFTTITNANFDNDVFYDRIRMTLNVKKDLIEQLDNKEGLSAVALYYANTNEEFDAKSVAPEVGVLATVNEDVRSLRELITYGLKGLSAYLKHANVLGFDDEEIQIGLQETLVKLLDDSLTADELVQLTLNTGALGVKGMEL